MTISLLPFSMIMNKRRARSKDTPVELFNMMTEFSVSRIMGMTGGLGLLITGGAMAGIGGYPWFAFGEFPWLAWKQTVYFGILGINFALMVPTAKKMMPMIAERIAQGSGGATDEIRALASRAGMFGMMMGILTLIAATFGAVKPNL